MGVGWSRDAAGAEKNVRRLARAASNGSVGLGEPAASRALPTPVGRMHIVIGHRDAGKDRTHDRQEESRASTAEPRL